jgi:RNA polymerase sigma-70 factor (ECF subfamily)
LPPDTNVPAYILTVVKHKCIDYLRREQVRRDSSDRIARLHAWEVSEKIATLEELEPSEIFTTEIQDIVKRTLNELPEQTRCIFRLSRNENKSHKEIAACLGITSKAIEFHITKATKALRSALKDYLPVLCL